MGDGVMRGAADPPDNPLISSGAGVVKLVDAGDSKSPGALLHVGSSPTSGTNKINELSVHVVTSLNLSRFPLLLHCYSQRAVVETPPLPHARRRFAEDQGEHRALWW